jgi:hypothetical protein
MAVHAPITALHVWCIGVLLCAATPAAAQSTFKVASFNIQSGKGEPALPGRAQLFADTANCSDPAAPLNGWGVGFVQQHLQQAIGSDPSIVALGLTEAWLCGSEKNVRTLLGWRAHSTNRNGVAVVARHGFAGPEEWVQLDTGTNLNPADTMWVLRVPVCLNTTCSAAVDVFAAHWYANAPATATYEQWKALVPPTLDRQAEQTVAFLRRTAGSAPQVLIGDLNTWESSVQMVCSQYTPNAGLNRLRDAGYVDAWPLLHGGAEGFTGMTNRARCGVPEGYAWKRIDYVWSLPHFLPVSISRFGVVTAGDPAPSDHYGVIAEFPLSGITMPPPPPPPPTIPAGPEDIVLYAAEATITGTAWQTLHDTQAAGSLRLWNPDQGAAKVTTAAGQPTSFAEQTFTASAGRPYHVWIRGRAENNSWSNDSLFVQFSNTTNLAGAPVFRIGSTDATVIVVEEASGAGLSNWGWQDNGYGVNVLGTPILFATSGTQRIRIQQREDGVALDQIVLSPTTFFSVAPGASKNDTTIYTKATGSVSPVPAPAPPSAPGEIILAAADATYVVGRWQRVTDPTAAAGVRFYDPEAGEAKLLQAAAQPAHYIEFTVSAVAGVPYRLWMRGRAEQNLWTNDSVFVQFTNTVGAAGLPHSRIGTTGATVVSIEEGSGAGLSGWGWADNGYGTAGEVVVFATTGTQTIRIQPREDGISIDQVVLSPQRYLTLSPGLPRNDATLLR